ncbi:putative polypeptide N-acetylgalactosaminyltransferase 10 [Liolophura sinensis]|uniref:putative polypeptide N-acetylgalactosaminyltransferase 10 n=1 Tax=Liolophura sinensis TaxID=3198878 RepID=UPI0031592A12
MRRNSVTLLKFVIAAAVFIVTGPMALRFLMNKSGEEDSVAGVVKEMGLPQAPRDARDAGDAVKVFDQLKALVKDEGHRQGAQAEDPMEKIDWHNYKQIAEEEQRKGPGEQGQAVILSPEEEAKKDALYRVNGFNAFASDKISLDRSLKDIRHEECKSKKYVRKLPTASIVVPFHNEHWTTLLRTVHSVINRSPAHLLHEVILADDFSNKEFLGSQLEEYVKKKFDKVKVVRAKRREGLIRTRLLGARAATGDVVIFLDSHVEANINWLPPLLEPIALNRKTVVCPFIDVIDFETFAYRAQDEGARGAFDWEFFYKRLPLLPEDLKHPSDPFKSPVMAGGLFAMDRKFFWELGGYDPGLDIWGGEQYELSFKIWQCHGEMVDAPCSRVGHIYRKFAPFPNPGVGDFVGRNYKRVAEVWMDEYKDYLYQRRPHYRQIDAGDLSAQLAIRSKHKCKPFKWFMKEVAFDLPNYYPPVEPKPFAYGEIRLKDTEMCIDSRFKGANEKFGLEKCIKDGGSGGEQEFEMTWHKDLRPKKRNVCFDASQSIPKAPVILFSCHGMKGNQWWKYNMDTNQLKHVISNQCLDADAERKDVYMNPCDTDSNTQKWTFGNVNETAVRREWIRN